MRHAEAAPDAGSTGDHARPLTHQGRRDALAAGLAMGEASRPDAALASDSRRTRETLHGVMEGLGAPVPHRFTRALYGASPSEILSASLDPLEAGGTLLVIGHNPGMGDLLRAMGTACDPDTLAALARFAPASFAVVSYDPGQATDLRQDGRVERVFTIASGLLPPRR